MEFVRKGKRTYGVYLETSTSKVYVAFRTSKDFFLDAKKGLGKSIAEAFEDGSASWAIDDSLLREARHRGCRYVGVWVKKMGWMFLTPIENYFDPFCYYRRNYASRGGSDQRYLPTTFFRQRSREVKL